MEFTQEQLNHIAQHYITREENQKTINKIVDQTIAREREKLDAVKEQLENAIKTSSELEDQFNTLQEQFKTVQAENEQFKFKSVFEEAISIVETELGEKVSPAVKKLIQLKGIKDKDELVNAIKVEVEEDNNYFNEKAKSKNLVLFEKEEEIDDVNTSIPNGSGEKVDFKTLIKTNKEKAYDAILEQL